MLVGVVLAFLDPLLVLEAVLEPPEELVGPDRVPVEAVVVPDIVLFDVVVAAAVVPVVVATAAVEPMVVAAAAAVPVVALPDVAVVVVAVPVRSTEPVAVPVDAATLVDEVDELSLELPPIEPQALRTSVQVRDAARHADSRAPAQLNRLNNIHPTQSSWLLNSL